MSSRRGSGRRNASPRLDTYARRKTVLQNTGTNLACDTPLQRLAKEFNTLNTHISILRRHQMPNGFESIFKAFTALKNSFTKFSALATKINKRNSKSNKPVEINEDEIKNIESFSLDFGDFLKRVEDVSNEVSSLYQIHFDDLFNTMCFAIKQYIQKCLLDHRTRAIMLDQESFFTKMMDSCYKDLKRLIQSENLSNVKQNQLAYIIEGFKQVARKFESGIPHEIRLKHLYVPEGDSMFRSFHRSFIELVPLINDIPILIEEMNIVFNILPPLGGCISEILNGYQLERLETCTNLPRIPSQLSLENLHDSFKPREPDPTKVYIPKIAGLFKLEVGEDESHSKEVLETIYLRAKSFVDNHEMALHECNTKYQALQDIKSETVYLERFGEVRHYKLELEKKFKDDMSKVHRDVLEMLSQLDPNFSTSLSDPLKLQVQCYISHTLSVIDKLKRDIKYAYQEIEQSKSIIEKSREKYFGKKTNTTKSLVTLIQEYCASLQCMNQDLDKEDDTEKKDNIADKFIKSTLKNLYDVKQCEINSYNGEMLEEMLVKRITQEQEEFKLFKEKYLEERKKYKGFKKSSIDKISQIRCKLEDLVKILVNVKTEENDSVLSFESLASKVLDLLEVVSKKVSERISLRSFINSFLGQLLHALNLPQVKFNMTSDEDLKDIMTQILESPLISSNLGTFTTTPRKTSKTSFPHKTAPAKLNEKTTKLAWRNDNRAIIGAGAGKSLSTGHFSLEEDNNKEILPVEAFNDSIPVAPAELATVTALSMEKDDGRVAEITDENTKMLDVVSLSDSKLAGIRTTLMECCSILESNAVSSFAYYPLPKLASTLLKLSNEKQKDIDQMKEYLAELCHLLNPQSSTRSDLLKQSFDDLFKLAYSSADVMIHTKQDLTLSQMRDICRGAASSDVDTLDTADIINLITNIVASVKEATTNYMEINSAIQELTNHVEGDENNHHSNSDHFQEYLERVEILKQVHQKVPNNGTLDVISNTVSNSINLILILSKTLSAAAFATQYQEGYAKFESIISRNTEIKYQNQMLTQENQNLRDNISVLKKNMFNFIRASSEAFECRLELLKKYHLDEVRKIVCRYEETKRTE